MKILDDEIRRRYDERRSAKTALWSNWIVKIILFVAVILLVRYFTNLHQIFQENGTNNIERVE